MYMKYLSEELTDLYYDLFEAQTDRDWELADDILRDITRLEEKENSTSSAQTRKEFAKNEKDYQYVGSILRSA